jgi:chromosome segregation ATPase
MSHVFRSALVVATFVSGAALGSAAIGRAQSPPTSQDVLSALLVEVKGLRVAMEQVAGAGPRIQLVLGRLQLQEQRVAEISKQLDVIRKSLGNIQQEGDMESQGVKTLEERLRGAFADTKERTEIERDIKQLAVQAEMRRMQMQRLQTEEAALAQDLASQQRTWVDLNQRLDELERSLGRKP